MFIDLYEAADAILIWECARGFHVCVHAGKRHPLGIPLGHLPDDDGRPGVCLVSVDDLTSTQSVQSLFIARGGAGDFHT